MKPVNLKSLALELNLSVPTVSRALNDHYDISQATKDRVRALASQLNYQPNPYASSLRRHKSRTIAVIVPEVANHFFALAINGIEEVSHSNNHHVLVYLTHDSQQREQTMVQLLAGGRVDGVLLSVASASSHFKHLSLLRERDIPLVFFDRVYEDSTYAKVTTNDYESGYQATSHLLDVGCRTIAHLTISETLTIGQRRKQGYQAALLDRGMMPAPDLLLCGQANKAQDVDRIEAMLRANPAIDGIFAAVESLAMGSYEACRRLGRRIGTDIKIIGFSNLETVDLLDPSLTTITQPAYNIGREAARILFQAVTKNRPISSAQSQELKSELVVRNSTVPGSCASAGGPLASGAVPVLAR